MGLREKFRQKFGYSAHKAGATQTSALSRGNKAESGPGVEAAKSGINVSIPSDHAGTSGSQALDDTPIRRLRDLAYDKLREEEEGAILAYEKKLQVCGDLGSVIGTGVPRRERMTGLLQRKMDEVNRDSWELRFGSHEVLVKDLAEPVCRDSLDRCRPATPGMIPSDVEDRTSWNFCAD
ncbi:hypothetical protein L209DRAFT_408187 [Thermothelomyces heterothallicus CBS 203.75]